MRILSLSTSDRGGGAEQVAWDLFSGLQSRGHESWMAVGQKHSSNPRVLEIHSSPHFDYQPFEDPEIQKTWELQRRERQQAGGEDFVYPYSQFLPELLPEPPDAVIAHNLHGGYFDLRSLPDLSKRVPVIAVLHDYWLLTGHCAYSFDCDRWRSGCGECPDLTLPPAILHDATLENLELKRSIYERSKIAVCSPSDLVLSDVKDSALDGAVVMSRRIPNGTDLSLFSPGKSASARERQGLPDRLPIILMLGNDLENNRFKDFHCAEECLRSFVREKRELGMVFLGAGEGPSEEQRGAVTVFRRPFIADREVIADYYRGADVLLHATRQEVSPLVLSEALASGLPSVASDVGNSGSLLGPGGFAVPAGDATAHVAALRKLLDDDNLRSKMGRMARIQAVKTGGSDAMVIAYEELLLELTEAFPF